MNSSNTTQLFKKKFINFIKFTDSKRELFINEVTNFEIGISFKDLSQNISQRLRITVEESNEYIQLLMSLIDEKEDSKLSTDEFVEFILNSLLSFKDKSLNITPKLKTQIRRLVDAEENSFCTTYKLINLSTERQKIILDFRVLTDIRPVYTDGETIKLKTAVILHTLKIVYEEDYEEKELYFALDKNDLQKLKELISRAEAKEKLIFDNPNISAISLI